MELRVNEEILNRESAAHFIGVCKSTLDKLKIPKIVIRRRTLYRRSDIEQWLDKNVKVEDNKNE